MEVREGHFEKSIVKSDLPKSLSVENIPRENRPILEDWREVQGGLPKLEPFIKDKFGNILSYNVVHNYENKRDKTGTGAVVLTPLFIAKKWDENPYIYRHINGREVWFPVALLWAYHGKPCETKSGDRYPRIGVNK
jgi:hypothetical protein